MQYPASSDVNNMAAEDTKQDEPASSAVDISEYAISQCSPA